jgi:hypothetical protein
MFQYEIASSSVQANWLTAEFLVSDRMLSSGWQAE